MAFFVFVMAKNIGEDKDKIMKAVCLRVSKGELVKFAAEAEGTTAQTIRAWALSDPKGLGLLYTRAREEQSHSLAEQAVMIADGEDALTLLYEQAIDQAEDAIGGTPNGSKIIASLRSNQLTRDRMRMDARKWLTSKIAPRLYGDKIEIAGDPDRPLQQEVRVRIEREGRRITAS